MALITKTVFSGRSDKVAKQYLLIKDAITAAVAVGTGTHFSRVSGTNEYDVEKDFITPSYNMDNLTADVVLANVEQLRSMISADVTHMSRAGSTTVDAYLSGQALNVSPEYDDLYYLARGSHLDGINVFSPAITLGTVAYAAGFVQAAVVGTGTGKRSTTTNNYAAAQLVFTVLSGIGGNNFVMNLRMLNESGGVVPETVTVTANASVGATFTTTNYAIDFSPISGITVTNGTAGDAVSVSSKVERIIIL